MQLDFVDDDIRGHTLLDAKVYGKCKSDRNQLPPAALFVLLAVVSTTPDKLDQKFAVFKPAYDIVEKYSQDPDGDENSNLTKLLDWCWRHGTFEKIRRLSEHSSVLLCYIS